VDLRYIVVFLLLVMIKGIVKAYTQSGTCVLPLSNKTLIIQVLVNIYSYIYTL